MAINPASVPSFSGSTAVDKTSSLPKAENGICSPQPNAIRPVQCPIRKRGQLSAPHVIGRVKELPCGFKSSLVLAAVGSFAKIWTNWFNRTNVLNIDKLEHYIENRTPLVTVCNHSSCADDPLIWGILNWKILAVKPYLMRWTLAAKEICFSNYASSKFFTYGRCMPTIRGHGVYQKSVDKCIEVLEQNGWVHVFPEGKVNIFQDKMRLKWGVGRIIADSAVTPTVVPMWHVGMDGILPNNRPYIPRMRKKLTVLIGDPIHFENMLSEMRKQRLTAIDIRSRITQCIQDVLYALKEDAEKLHHTALDT